MQSQQRMPQPSTIAARCAALSTSIIQVVPLLSSFARKVRDSRHDLNAINNDLLVIKTGLGVAQDDFSIAGSHLPASLVDAMSQILDSCDDTSERLHKAFLKLSCSSLPKDDWQFLKNGSLIHLRQDLDASKVVLDLALDYTALFGPEGTLESLMRCYVSDLLTESDDLVKRTDMEEIYVNQTARDRLPSLLQAVRLLRSCITAVSRKGVATSSQSARRTLSPRPDSLEPSLGDVSRNDRLSPPQQTLANSTASKGIGNWLANVPSFEDPQLPKHPAIKRVAVEKTRTRAVTRSDMIPSRGTFYTDDGLSSGRTLVPPEPRIRKSRSWCSDFSRTPDSPIKIAKRHDARLHSTMSMSSDVSIFHKKITSDKIAVAKSTRKDMNAEQRGAVDRILANIPAEATAAEVERILWEGANPMAAHPEYGFFFIRAAYEMSPDCLRVLMEFGADITCTIHAPTLYYSAMHAATLGCRLDTARYLVSLGHSIDQPNTAGETPLHLAAKTPGGYEMAKYLLDMGADVNYETHDGQTPLQAALNSSKLEGKPRSMLIGLLHAHGAEGEFKREMDRGGGNSKGKIVLGIT